jgi:hypothetical protein
MVGSANVVTGSNFRAPNYNKPRDRSSREISCLSPFLPGSAVPTQAASTFHPLLGWFVEVALDADSRWNGRMFVPEHFFALCASTFMHAAEAVTERAADAGKVQILCRFSGS